MNLEEMSIENLFELRTKMILEKSDISNINFIIDEKENEYSKMIVEDTSTGSPSGAVTGGDCGSGGVAYSNASNVSGMGAVVSSQPSSYAGSTIGSDFTSGGGTIGSGDIGVPYNASGTKMFQKMPVQMGKNHGPRTGKKSRVKRFDIKAFRNALSQKQDYTSGQGERKTPKVMNFNDFSKSDLMKVTKVKQ